MNPIAVTKIWPIKDSIKRVLNYAANPDKTEYSDIQSVLHYAENDSKTCFENEKTLYVTGINCSAETAFQEMKAVQERFDKRGGNVAYHAYQSFKTGEVTPELCHKLGVELARKMWGTDYQVLVATHFNTGTYHNHLVVNSLGMWDGKKFNCNEGAYWRFRALSDELCQQHELTVIKNPAGKTPRKIYFAEKNGEPTKFNLMREAIDYAISVSFDRYTFNQALNRQGYVIESENRKYPTIRSMNSKKAVRMWRLGENYELERIYERVKAIDSLDQYVVYRQYNRPFEQLKYHENRKYRVHFPLSKMRKYGGFKALYFHYCYLLGAFKRKENYRPLSPEMREAVRNLKKLNEETKLILRENFETVSDVKSFIEGTDLLISNIQNRRNELYNKLRKCADDVQISALKEDRNECTSALKSLRNERKNAQNILDRSIKMKKEIVAERAVQWEFHRPKQYHKGRYEYDRDAR